MASTETRTGRSRRRRPSTNGSGSRPFLPPTAGVAEPFRLTPQLALRLAILGGIAIAVFGILFTLLFVWLVRLRSRHVWGALVVLGVLAVQMTVGEIQYRVTMPWWLVLIHVTLAATLWAATVAFVAALWRPSNIP